MTNQQPEHPAVIFFSNGLMKKCLPEPDSVPPIPDNIIRPQPLTPVEQNIEDLFESARRNPKSTKDEDTSLLAELRQLLQAPSPKRFKL